jgi:esterase/lipase superfamily enzyme
MRYFRSLHLPSTRFAAATALAVLALVVAACSSIELAGGMPKDAMADATATGADDQDLSGREIVQLASLPSTRPPLLGSATSRSLTAPVEAPAAAAVPRTGDNLFDVVTVFWGTDRVVPAAAAALADDRTARRDKPTVTGSIPKASMPTAGRADRLTLGRARVTVPRIARSKGKILRPRQVTFLNVSLYSENEDPRKHFTIGDLETLGDAAFVRAAQEHGAKAERFKDQAFVFVHGYNVTFENALYRTAQLAYDLEFDGVPYLYSWPSKGEESGYLYDRDSADRARGYFLSFLRKVASETKAKKVHIIAHSMGTRPLLEALRTDEGRLARRLHIGEVILAAPDIDADIFREIAKTVAGAAGGFTLYASSNDRALKASKAIAGGKPRAGDVPAGGPIVVAGVDTIDITEAGPDSIVALNHTTYAERSHVLADMWLLLKEGVHPPDKRFAVYHAATVAGGSTYWKYLKN